MKKLHILSILIAMVTLASCTEEKTFDLVGYRTGNVMFTATNLSVGFDRDFASSIKYEGDYHFGGEYRDSVFVVDYAVNNEWEVNEGLQSLYVTLNYENQLWTAGYNEIEFTFKPSDPNEKSAKFTMPDGKVFEATTDNPSFVWTVTPDILRGEPFQGQYHVLAESEYVSGNTTYKNKGFIMLDLSGEARNLFCTNRSGIFIMSSESWVDVKYPTIYGNVDFWVRNTTVGDYDFGTSTYYNGYDTWGGERRVQMNLDIYRLNSDSVPEFYYNKEVNIVYSNQLWAGGDNDIRVVFMPRDKSEEVKLILPDGNTLPLNATDSVATFTIDRDFVNNCRDWNGSWLTVRAEGGYVRDGVNYVNRGHVMIEIGEMFKYDKSRSLWLYDDWLSGGTRSSARKETLYGGM